MNGKHIIYPKAAGIYKLTCDNNGKIYIGKSINIRKRLESHKNCKKHISTGYYFRNAVVKHGWESFTVEILEIFENFDKFKDNQALLDREAYYIKLFNSTENGVGYNIQSRSNDGTGNKKAPIIEKHRANLRKARALQVRGPLSEEHKQKLRGPKFPESIEKMRQTKKGSKLSEEHREKIRQSCMGNTHRRVYRKNETGKKRQETFRRSKTKNEKFQIIISRR